MGLTSTAVLAVVAALAVALFAATVGLWPRLGRPGAAAVSGRIGLLLATQLTLFAAVGLAANNAFLFYGSWADLFGRQQDLGVVTDHVDGETDAASPAHGARRHPAPGRAGRPGALGRRADRQGGDLGAQVGHRVPGVRLSAAGVLPGGARRADVPGGRGPHRLPGHGREPAEGVAYPQTAAVAW
ncbi:esterase [Streptomyces badius]